MRNIILYFTLFTGLVACVPSTKVMTKPIPMTITLSDTETQTTTETPKLEPSNTPTLQPTINPKLLMTKEEIVDFMVNYIVTKEIKPMIEIIINGGIPGINKPPTQFIIIYSPFGQPIAADYSNIMNVLDTKHANLVWIYKNGVLLPQTDLQKAISNYKVIIQNAPKEPSIFMCGYYEFGIASISKDGTNANIYLSVTCGSSCGHGLILTLAKDKDYQIVVTDMKPIWGS